tara:strand:- start:13 stop:318 length:306 start_codon:yes stop_codon:yes gene_type:complete
MGLELDWTDNATGVTYDDAYAIVKKLTYTKGVNNTYNVVAFINIYKDSTAYNDGKGPIAEQSYQKTLTIQPTDNAQTYRNAINQIYNDMKQDDPWDDAADV